MEFVKIVQTFCFILSEHDVYESNGQKQMYRELFKNAFITMLESYVQIRPRLYTFVIETDEQLHQFIDNVSLSDYKEDVLLLFVNHKYPTNKLGIPDEYRVSGYSLSNEKTGFGHLNFEDLSLITAAKDVFRKSFEVDMKVVTTEKMLIVDAPIIINSQNSNKT